MKTLLSRLASLMGCSLLMVLFVAVVTPLCFLASLDDADATEDCA